MPTIERTPAASVACCNTLGAQHATPARCAQHPAQQGAQRSPAPDVKTLAKQALERIEGRNGARNTERNTAVAGRCNSNECAQHPAAHERTARDYAGWRDYFEERAAIREHDGGLSRTDAEAGAFADCIARWCALNPLAASGDGACVHCGKARPDMPVLAHGGHAWLHRACWAPMNAQREAHAREAVSALLRQDVAADLAGADITRKRKAQTMVPIAADAGEQ